MDYLRQTIGSAELSGIFDLPQALQNTEVEVIILPAQNGKEKERGYKLQLGFLDLPPLPDSFFDPLPEEELQAWGL